MATWSSFRSVFSSHALFSVDSVQPVLAVFAPVPSDASVSLLSSEARAALDSWRSAGSVMTSVAGDALVSRVTSKTLLPRGALDPRGAPEAPHSFMSRTFTAHVTAHSVRDGVDLFEDVAADAVHPDAQRKIVSESSTELHQLHLRHVLSALQCHHQESADP